MNAKTVNTNNNPDARPNEDFQVI